jgi:hypothetical protein
MTRQITLDYDPRPHFVPFHQRNTRWSSIVAHRRCGKTVACINDLIPRALYNKKKNPRYGYIAPTYRQGKEIAWTYLKDFARPVTSKVREAELSLELINGSKISIFGADNPDSLRGLYFDGVILDEFGDMRPSVWGEVVLPTLVDRKGWAVFIGTPKGKNHFWEIHSRAANDSGWYCSTLKITDTGLFQEDEINEFRKQMSDEQFRQEFLCDFTAAIQGAYYASLLEEPLAGPGYNPDMPVFAASDLGYTDSTAYWFWQPSSDGYSIIDYEEADTQPLSYYFDLLRYKGYEYERIYLPHDAKAKSLQTGLSTIEQFVNAEFPVAIAPKLALQHGIDAARAIIPKCHWDLNNERVRNGIDALRSYRRAYDEKARVYRDTPMHDWSSHCADAFRYFALVTRHAIVAPPRVEEVKAPSGKYPFSLEDIWECQPKKSQRI